MPGSQQTTELQPSKRPPARTRIDSVKSISRTIAIVLMLALALLTYPSVLPWMVAFWLVWHTLLAKQNRPGWAPLVACLTILVIKLVPPTPTMIVFGVLLAVVAMWRFQSARGAGTPGVARASRWWAGAAILWIAWGFMSLEWRAIESCGRTLTLDADRPVVCIGDSLTQGLLPDHGYPEQLKSMIRLPVVNLGFSGISTSQGLGQLPRVLEHRPQVVVIELGGHDFLKGKSRASTKKNLEQMITECRAADAEVILMEIPRGFMIDPFASLEREVAYHHDVQLISDSWLRQIVVMSPIAPPGMWMPASQLSDDGIHSNERGSRAIAQYVADALQAMYGEGVLAKAD